MRVKVDHHQIKVGESHIHFVTAGEKSHPPLFLLHSFYLSGSAYDLYLPLLATRFYLVIPDLPGFGKSEKLKRLNISENYAGVIEAIRRSLILPKINLFGFSAGGAVALKYAALFQKSVVRVSVQGAPYFYHDYDIILRDKILLWLTANFPHFPRLLKTFARYQFVWRLLRFFYQNLDRTMKALGDVHLKEAIENISPQAAYEWGQDIIKIDLRSDLKNINCPVQIIASRKDPYLTIQSVYRMASLLPDAEVFLVGGDHEITIKEPDRIAVLLNNFLAGP